MLAVIASNRIARLGLVLALPTVWACSGEQTLTPARRIVAVILSRDSASLDVGDSVALRADAADANGVQIVDAVVTWSTLDPGVVTVRVDGATGWVKAIGAGAARVVASSGNYADTTDVAVPPPMTGTALSLHLDTLTALGDSLVVDAISQSASGPRIGHYTPVARNASVSVATTAGGRITLLAANPGASYVVVQEHQGSRDSVLVVVHQREAKVELTPDSLSWTVGHGYQLTVAVFDPRHNPINGAPVTFVALDTLVATVNASGLVTYTGPGVGRIVATAAGAADTTIALIQPMPRLSLYHHSIVTGVGLFSDTLWVDGGGPWIRLTVADTTIAQAPDSVLPAQVGGVFYMLGKALGVTRLIATSPPFMAPDTLQIRVTPSRLHLVDPDYGTARSPLLPIGTDGSFYVVTQDSLGATRNVGVPVSITVTSSDTTILKLPQNQAPFDLLPRSLATQLFPAVPVDTGKIRVVASATGFSSDSLEYLVTASPRLRFMGGAQHVIAAGQTVRGSEPRNITTTRGWSHGSDLLITFTRRHPAVGLFPDTLTLPVNALYWPFSYTGLAPGVDTIVASAPGYDPDTAFLAVSTPHFVLSNGNVMTTLGGAIEVAVVDSIGGQHAPVSAVPLRAVPADTAIVRRTDSDYPALWPVAWTLGIAAVDTGVSTVVVSDSAGLYVPASTSIRVVLDSSIKIVASDGYGYGPPAPHERFDETRLRIVSPSLSAPTVVHLVQTVPGVLQMPDSVVIGAPDFFGEIFIAGARVGATRVVASAHGFVPDTSGPVTVAEGRLRLIAPTTTYVGGAGYTATVQVASKYLVTFPFPLDTALTFALVSVDSGVVADSTVTVAAGQYISPTRPIAFTKPGIIRFAVEDHHLIPGSYRADTLAIAVTEPVVALVMPSAPIVGVGQRLRAQLRRPAEVSGKAAQVTVSHSANRSVSAQMVTLPAGADSLLYAIDGVSEGIDTVTVTAPGYAPDTVIVSIGDGSVKASNWPSTMRQGDSVAVTLQICDSAGYPHAVTQATTFAISSDGGIAFSDGAHAIHSITVPAGLGITSQFYVKAVGPTGAASARFLNLFYAEQTFALTVTP